MIIRCIYCSLFILIQFYTFIQQISTCPIPFHVRSKCRCAITETGRVYIYCARKELTSVPNFDSSKLIEKKNGILCFCDTICFLRQYNFR